MLQQATHIYSGTKGTIIGYHSEKKAHLIKLSTGQQQYWRDNAVIKIGEVNMTDKIMFKLSGERNKWFNVIERYFDGVEEAHQYLSELGTLNQIHSFSKNGLCASLSNGWNISSNYDIREILKHKPEEKLLPSVDIKKAIKLKSSHKKQLTPDTLSNPTLKSKRSINGKTVKLQDLTNDSRKARVVLRNLVRNGKITKPGRWEWEEGSPDLEIVKSALSK